MKKLENKTDLITWAKSVNTPCNNISDLQDMFAYSKQVDLRDYFMELTANEKELVVFAIGKCMGSAELLRFITVYSRRKAEEYIEAEGDEIARGWNELAQAQVNFKNEKDSLAARIERLQHQNKELTRDNDIMTQQLSDKTERCNDMADELRGLQDELTKQYAFEAHIKELIAR